MWSLFYLALGNEDVGFQLVYESACAWRGGLFLTEGKIGVLSVSFLFWTRVGVYVGVCVCIRIHTHNTQMGYLDVSPGVGTRHLEGPQNPDGLNLGTHIFAYVYKVLMCIYILRGGMRSWTKLLFSVTFFSSGKENKRCGRKTPIISNLNFYIWAHRTSIKGTKPRFIVIKAIIIIILLNG